MFICGIALAACKLDGSDLCRNNELQTNYSPGGDRKAVVFQRDCGATTGFSTQVSILRSSEKLPNKGGNTFIADTDKGQAPDGRGGGPEIKLRWVKEEQVEVIYDKRARVFRKEEVVDGVKIKYEQR
jgi:hypothetical protein